MQFIVPSHGLLLWGISILIAFVYAIAGIVGTHAVTKEEISTTVLMRTSNIEGLISNAIIFPIVFLLIDNQALLENSYADKNWYWFGIIIFIMPLVLSFVIVSKNFNSVDNGASSKKIYNFLYVLIAVGLFFFFYEVIKVPKIELNCGSFYVKRPESPNAMLPPHFFIRLLLGWVVIFIFNIVICLFGSQKGTNGTKNLIDTWISVINWCVSVFIIPLMIAALDTGSKCKISLPYFYDIITDFLLIGITYILLKIIHKEEKNIMYSRATFQYSNCSLNLTVILEVIIVVGTTVLLGYYQLHCIASSIHYFQNIK